MFVLGLFLKHTCQVINIIIHELYILLILQIPLLLLFKEYFIKNLSLNI